MKVDIKRIINYDKKNITINVSEALIFFLSSLKQNGIYIRYNNKVSFINCCNIQRSINFFLFDNDDYEIYTIVDDEEYIKHKKFINNSSIKWYKKEITQIDDTLISFIIDNDIICYSLLDNFKIKLTDVSDMKIKLFYYNMSVSLIPSYKENYKAYIILSEEEMLYYDLLFSDKE